jgi:hypothetical protein
MTEIKRYSLMTIDLEYNPGITRPWMEESQRGEWVRWEDIEGLIQAEPRAITPEDTLKGMDAAFRGESNRPGVINGPGFVDQNQLSLKERAK